MVKSSISRSKGSALTAVLITLGGLVCLVALVALYLMSVYNAAVRHETGLTASHLNNQNILSAYSHKVVEAAQVPDMMRDDLIKVAKAALEGRYGADGSKAVFQAIREQNPTVSEQLYVKLQNIVVAGRDEFKVSQTTLLDKRRVYETALQSMPGGLFLGMMGFPKVKLETFDPVITDAVEATFAKHREAAPLQLRPKAP